MTPHQPATIYPGHPLWAGPIEAAAKAATGNAQAFDPDQVRELSAIYDPRPPGPTYRVDMLLANGVRIAVTMPLAVCLPDLAGRT